MAEEIVDALVLTARFDIADIDKGARALTEGVNAAVQAAKSGKPIEVADTESLRIQARELENIAQRSLMAVRSLERLNVAESKIAATMAENGLLTREQANALLQLAQNAQAALASLSRLPETPTATPAAAVVPIPPNVVKSVHDVAFAMGEVAAQSTPLTRALTSAAVDSQAVVAPVTAMTAAMSAVAAQSTAMTRAMTSAAAESRAFATEVSVMAAAMSEVAAQSTPMTRAMTSAAAGSQVAAKQIHAITAAMSEVAAESNAMTRAMASAAAETNQIGNAAAGVAGRTRNLNQQLGIVAKGADTTQAGIARLRSGLAQLAVLSVETTSPVGQVAQGLLFQAGATSTLVIALAGAIAGYQALTRSARQAKEAQEGVIAAQRQRLAAQGPGDPTLTAAIRADQERLRDLQKDIQDRTRAIVQDQAAGIPTILEELALRKKIAEQRDIELSLQADSAAQQRNITDETLRTVEAMRAQQAAQAQLFASLGGQLAELQTGDTIAADAAQRRQTIAATEGLTDAQRKAAQSLSDLIEKLQRSAKAHKEAEDAAHFQAQFLDQLAEAGRRATVASAQFANEWSDEVFKQIIDGAKESTKQFEDFAAGTREMVDSLMTAEEIVREFQQQQRDAFDFIAQGIGGIADTANRVGILSDGFADATFNALNLGKAIQEITLTGASLGNILGAIGPAVGFVGGLVNAIFGGESEHDRLIRENSERLHELATGLNQFKGPLGLERIGTTVDIAKPLSQGGRGIIGFQQALDDAGITLKAFAKIVEEQTGISILDDKGHLAADALAQAAEAADKMREAALKFDQSLSDIDTRMRAEAALGLTPRAPEGIDQAAFDKANRDRELLLRGVELDAAREAKIRALDLSTVRGREAFLAEEKRIFDEVKAGRIKLEDAQSAVEVFGLIADSADSVNALSDAAKNAAKNLGDLNLPAGFKRALTVFDAEPFGPSRGEGASLPIPTQHRGTDINVTVHVAAGMSAPEAQEAARKGAEEGTVVALRRSGHMVFGDSIHITGF